MSVNPSRGRRGRLTSPGVSRRGFIQAASAAGAAAFSGYVPRAARAADENPDNGKKAAVDPKRPTCIAPLDNGNFVTCDDEGNVRQWSILDGKVAHVQKFSDHAGKATFVATANPLVFTAGYDGTVVVRNLGTNEVKKFTKHREKKEVWAVAADPHGSVLSATNDGQILLWNAGRADASERAEYIDDGRDDPVGGLAFVPDNDKPPTRFLSTHSHGDINLWTIGGKAHPKTFSHRNSHHVNAVAVTSDGKRFVSAGFDRTLRVWDVDDKRNPPQPVFPPLKGHRHWIWRLAISHDNSKVASASQDGTVRLWDLGTGLPLGKPTEVGERGSMGVAFVKTKQGDEFLVYTTNHLQDPNKADELDQVRLLKL